MIGSAAFQQEVVDWTFGTVVASTDDVQKRRGGGGETV